jgi:cation:H+ antiporter
MNIILDFVLFTVSLLVLLKAADWFINSAERIGLSFGVAPFIIGVTVVSFGTSLPELATSIAAVYAGNSEIVVANVVGSNITNIALIIGIIAIVAKEVKIDADIMHIDMPQMLASAAFLWFILMDNKITMVEAIICMVGIVIFVSYSVNADRLLTKGDRPIVAWWDYLVLLGGALLIYFSATYTISFATSFASSVGMPTKIVGLVMIALGTSLPELIVSLQAIRRGKTGIAVGNVLGSNIFNAFIVIAIPRFFGELIVPESIHELSLPFMLMLTVLFAFMCITKRISNWEGMILVLLYIYFITQLF